MKLSYEVFLDDVVALLSLAAMHDGDLLMDNLKKSEIKEIVHKTLKAYGMNRLEGWSDGLKDGEAGAINGWAYAQASKYTF